MSWSLTDLWLLTCSLACLPACLSADISCMYRNACLPHTASDRANSSSACWVRCFFNTLLGPNATENLNGTGAMPVIGLRKLNLSIWFSQFRFESATNTLIFTETAAGRPAL
jgi:hypothetical protein